MFLRWVSLLMKHSHRCWGCSQTQVHGAPLSPIFSPVIRSEGQQLQKLLGAPQGGKVKPRVFFAPGKFLPLLPTEITESDHCNLKPSVYALTSVPWGDFSSAAMEHHAALLLLFSSHWTILVKITLSGHPPSWGLGSLTQSMAFPGCFQRGQTWQPSPANPAWDRLGLLILLCLSTARLTPHLTFRELNLQKVNTTQSDHILKKTNPNAGTR